MRPGDIADQIVSDAINSIAQRRPVGFMGVLLIIGIVALIRRGVRSTRRDHVVSISDELER